MRRTSLVTVCFALVVSSYADSSGAKPFEAPSPPYALASSSTSVQTSSNRLLRVGDALDDEDSESRGLNGWSLKNLKARISWTKEGKEAAQAKRAAIVEKLKKDKVIEDLLHENFAKWYVEGKSVAGVINHTKNVLRQPDWVSLSMGGLYEEWLISLKLLKKKKKPGFLSNF